MSDEQAAWLKAEGMGLRVRRFGKDFRGDKAARDPAAVEIFDVLQTARRT